MKKTSPILSLFLLDDVSGHAMTTIHNIDAFNHKVLYYNTSKQR